MIFDVDLKSFSNLRNVVSNKFRGKEAVFWALEIVF